MKTDFGFLILAIKKDYKKAIALSLRIRHLMPGIPIAVAASPPSLEEKLRPFFDEFIHQDPKLKGFEHKLYLDKYSPFDKTFYLDADILMIEEISDFIRNWTGSAYAVRGHIVKEGMSSFGLDRKKVLNLISRDEFMNIDGAGHAYFEKPACYKVFDEARNIVLEYDKFGADGLADEDVIGIALSKFGIKPKENNELLGSPWCAINNSFSIDVNKNICSYEDKLFGTVNPSLIHFATLAKPFTYAKEMQKVFRGAGYSFPSVYIDALVEFLKFKKWSFFNKIRNRSR